jgi:hypothetical protein
MMPLATAQEGVIEGGGSRRLCRDRWRQIDDEVIDASYDLVGVFSMTRRSRNRLAKIERTLSSAATRSRHWCPAGAALLGPVEGLPVGRPF